MTFTKTMTTSSILVAALCVALVGGCGETETSGEDTTADYQDDNLNAGDPESGGSGGAGGGGSGGNNPDKVTLCHIPRGNPANAHTITVSSRAVQAHLMHGDTLGECAGSGNPGQDGGTSGPDGGGGGGGEPGPDAGTPPPPDAGPTCTPRGAACQEGVPCCDGLQCAEGVCTIILG